MQNKQNNIPYIILTWESTPRSDENIVKENAVTAIIQNKDTGLYLALEFIKKEFWLVGGRLEKWENKEEAIIREVEEEAGYKNATIKSIIFEKAYSRGYKARKKSEIECEEKIFFVEVEEKNQTEILWADYGTKGVFWFTQEEMLERLTLTHHIYFFEAYLCKEI